MMKYVISIEGQSIEVPEEVGISDDAVRLAMAPYYPGVSNSLISRSSNDENDVVTITIVKKAGSKGSKEPSQFQVDSLTGPSAELGGASGTVSIEYLKTCEGGKNPAIALYEELDAMNRSQDVVDPLDLYEISDRIESAIDAGEKQKLTIDRSMQRLSLAVAQPSRTVLMGF